jgi:hypothetical protein
VTENDPELDALLAECKSAVTRLRDVKGTARRRLVRETRDRVRAAIRDGLTDPDEIAERVYEELDREEFGSIILTAILIAVISFVVKKILEHFWPDKDVRFARFGR